MTAFDNLIKTMTDSAIDVLEDFHKQTAIDAGLDPTRANAWDGLHATYFGPTTSPQKQRLARDKARRSGLSLDQLALIERKIKKISSNRTKAKLRLALLDATGNYKALARLAKRLVPGQDKDSPPRKQVTFSRTRAGRRTMTVTAEQRDMADLEHALMTGADTAKPVAPQMLENFLRLMRGFNPPGTTENGGTVDGGSVDGSTENNAITSPNAEAPGVPYAVPRPLILIPLHEWVKIHKGEGDETILQLTDGTTMTGAEFLNTYYATAENYLEAATFHVEEGAVNLYRGRRLANDKQRTLARATSPTCPVPDCRHGADACEIHHITAWKHGGETNIANLAPLCRYHNRANDDDPRAQSRGRVQMVRNVPRWISPGGKAVANSRHGPGAMELLFSG